MIQYRRMINEEKILTSSAFPEYRAYAARTPLVIPARLAGFYRPLKSRLIYAKALNREAPSFRLPLPVIALVGKSLKRLLARAMS